MCVRSFGRVFEAVTQIKLLSYRIIHVIISIIIFFHIHPNTRFIFSTREKIPRSKNTLVIFSFIITVVVYDFDSFFFHCPSLRFAVFLFFYYYFFPRCYTGGQCIFFTFSFPATRTLTQHFYLVHF